MGLLVRSTSQTPREQTTMILKQEEEMRKYKDAGGGEPGFFGLNPYTSLLGGSAPKEDAGTSFSSPPQ